MIGLYRRHPGILLLTALAVFLPLNVVRYGLVDRGWFPAAIGLTLLGHVALVPLLRRRPDLDLASVRFGAAVAAAGLVAVTALEVVGGLAVEAVVGRSTFGITLGGLVPSVLLGPAWAVLVIGGRQRAAAARGA